MKRKCFYDFKQPYKKNLTRKNIHDKNNHRTDYYIGKYYKFYRLLDDHIINNYEIKKQIRKYFINAIVLKIHMKCVKDLSTNLMCFDIEV